MSEAVPPPGIPTGSGNRRAPRRLLRWGGLFLAAVGLLALRVLLDSREVWLAGQRAEAGNDPAAATRHYLHAIRMYLPGSPYVGGAVGRLEALAGAGAAAADLAGERAAREALRAGLLGARSFYTPFADRLAASDRQLAGIYARIEDPAVAPGASIAERTAWHLERLRARPGPGVPGTLAALGGFALWLGAAVVFIRRGLDGSLRPRRGWAIGSGVAFLFGFALFLLGLRFA